MTIKASILAEGIFFGEGPRWREGRLWFSDFFDRTVKSISEAGDLRAEFSLNDDRPSGLGWTPEGDLLIVSMQKRQLLKRDAAGAILVHADLSSLAAFHCNDMVVDAKGRAYVGNFGFDLDHELEARGAASVIGDHPRAKMALVEANGAVREAAGDLSFPNGTVISDDGRTLILAETLGLRLTAFDIAEDGTLSNRRLFADVAPRVPDGICLDAEGAVWIANATGAECARIAEGGAVLEVVETSQPCFACMLGGEDGKTLFALTAPTSLAHEAAKKPLGRIETARVSAPRAGRP